MYSLLKSSVQTLFHPILTILGMQHQQQPSREYVLDLPSDTPQDVGYWCTSAMERHISRPTFRDCKVTHIRRYKKAKNSEHEYLSITVEHPVLGIKHLRIERSLAHVDDNGVPVLRENQLGTPPTSPQGDFSQGFWTTWTPDQDRSDPRPPKPIPKPSNGIIAMSANISKKVGQANDVVRLWDPPFPLAGADTVIENLDLKGNPLPLVYLAILANAVHDQESLYNLFLTQCYWYSCTIARVVARETSLKIPESGNPATDTDHCYDKKSGTFLRIPIHWVRPHVINSVQEEYKKRCEAFKEEVERADREVAEIERERAEVQRLREDYAAAQTRIREMGGST